MHMKRVTTMRDNLLYCSALILIIDAILMTRFSFFSVSLANCAAPPFLGQFIRLLGQDVCRVSFITFWQHCYARTGHTDTQQGNSGLRFQTVQTEQDHNDNAHCQSHRFESGSDDLVNWLLFSLLKQLCFTDSHKLASSVNLYRFTHFLDFPSGAIFANLLVGASVPNPLWTVSAIPAARSFWTFSRERKNLDCHLASRLKS